MESAKIAAVVWLCTLAVAAVGCGGGDSDDGSDSRDCASLEKSDVLGGAVLGEESCYQVAETLKVRDGELVVQAGTTVYFERDAGLSVEQHGRLVVDGADEPVVLRGDRDERGYWRGIRLSASGPHTIEGARVADAGGASFSDSVPELRGGITVVSNAVELAVEDVDFENHEHTAVLAGASGADAQIGIDDSRFADNDAPLRVHAHHLEGLGMTLSFEDNRNQKVIVEANDDYPVTGSVDWPLLEVPYRFDGVVRIEGDVTVAPATSLRFDRHAGLDVDGGQLRAVGTADQPIRFEGANDVAGYWRGLRFRDTPTDAENRLEHAHVLHAGSEQWVNRWSNSQANILVHDGGQVTINHAVIAEGDYHGISIREGLVEGCVGIEYHDLYRHPHHTYADDEGCS